jgi:electron transfer flavoprotein beta subunit
MTAGSRVEGRGLPFTSLPANSTLHPRPSTLFIVTFPVSKTRTRIAVKIAVCVKRVPEMDVKFKIASSGTAVDETGLKFDMSDFDGYAVEFALQTTEKLGAGEVTVVSLGPDTVQETLRKALSMGAARAVHLRADAVPVDSYAVSQALAAELKDGAYDLILFGKMAADTASGAVGLMVAESLGMPMVQACTKLSFEGGKGIARREVEGGAEMVTFSLPACASIDEGIARPRYPSLKGIMAAKKKPMDVKPAQLGAARLTVLKMELPPERQPGRIIGEGAAAVPELVRLLRDEAKVL